MLALFIGTTYGVSVRFSCVTVPYHWHGFTIRFRNLHSFSQARALCSLELEWIQRDCTSCLTFHPTKLYASNDNNPTWC